MNNIKYGTKTINFEIERKPRLKNTYIYVGTSGVLVKTNRSTSIKTINEMVSKRSAWITKKLEMFKKVTVNTEIVTGSRLYYMGKSYFVEMIKNKNVNKVTINFTNAKFYINTPEKYLKVQLYNAIENFYMQKAIEKIIPLTQKWAKIMNVSPAHISFRRAKRRWGSCNSVNRISFNYHLIKLYSSLIEYVVIHELAHIQFHNHSKDFWDFVHKHLSDYKIKQEKIRAFERLL